MSRICFLNCQVGGGGRRGEDKEIELNQKDQILIIKVRDRYIGIHCTVLSSFVYFFLTFSTKSHFGTVTVHSSLSALPVVLFTLHRC